ncbi:hypothetical protein BH23PAT2_BH23PAT2_00510 [soil metagenome]
MDEYNEAFRLTDERMHEAGFSERTLDQMNLPENQTVEHGENRIPYAIFGDRDARIVVPNATPYLTFMDPHFKLRLAAKQAALGEDFCVVGIGAYEPAEQALSLEQRRKIKTGDFSPLSERMVRVVDSLKLNEEQSVMFDGYSLGGDIAVQTTHDILFDEHKGVCSVEALSVSECARMVRRGAALVTIAMAQSGKRLVENIVDSEVPSLLEAWNIDPNTDMKTTKKAVNSAVNRGAIKYWTSGIQDNWAITRGFGTDASKRQIIDLADETQLLMLITRAKDSKVFPKQSLQDIATHTREREGVLLGTEDNDHSGDDNIRRSAARILYLAQSLRHPEA